MSVMDTASKDHEEESAEKNISYVAPEEKDASQNNIVVPDGGFGWFVVVAFFLYNFSTWGANAGYAIYLAHYLEYNSYPGAGKLDYAAIGGFAFGCGLFFGPAINWLVHRTCVQFVIGVGIILQCAALLLAAFSKKLWQLYLTQGVLISFGLAFICIPSMTLLPQWFREKRSLAMGLGSGGTGLGGIIFNLGMQRIIEIKSVKLALIVQCVICTSLSVVALILTRTREKEIQGHSKAAFKVFDLEVIRCTGYWLIVFYISLTMSGYVVLLYSMSSFTVSLGYSEKQGSIVSCMISVGALFGRPAIGFVSDFYGPVSVSIIVHLTVAIFSWAMWIPCLNFTTALIFALIVGLLMGSIWSVMAPIVTRVVGLHKLGVTFGMLWIYLSMFSIVAPIIGLELRTNNQSRGNNYIKTAIFAGFDYFGSALFLWLLRGHLIARDEQALKEETDFDNGELHLKVSTKDAIRGLFRFTDLPRNV